MRKVPPRARKSGLFKRKGKIGRREKRGGAKEIESRFSPFPGNGGIVSRYPVERQHDPSVD